ncbi:unnamed protein product, partial [Rotaria sp. Silwood2]
IIVVVVVVVVGVGVGVGVVFDWLMQNHLPDSNSSMGLDQNDDDEHTLKPKPDDDSLENVS